MRISDWSSDVCSSDLCGENLDAALAEEAAELGEARLVGNREQGALDRRCGVDGHDWLLHRRAVGERRLQDARLVSGGAATVKHATAKHANGESPEDRKSFGSGKSASVRFDNGWRRGLTK